MAKAGAHAFITIGMGISRFDTKDGRKKSDVAGFDMDFKFHETVQVPCSTTHLQTKIVFLS